jgi:hypothetical protein
MPKIVVLGSLKHEPYEMLAPKMMNPELHAQGPEGHELAYVKACEVFYPAIERADLVLVWLPGGKISKHTKADMMFAISQRKRVVLITPNEVLEI